MKKNRYLLAFAVFMFTAFSSSNSLAQFVLDWQRSIGGSSSDYLGGVYPTSDHGFILGGKTNSQDGDVVGSNGNSNGNSNGWLVKVDSGRNIQWQKFIGTFSLYSVGQTNDSAYLVISSDSITNGVRIQKFDSLGTIISDSVIAQIIGGFKIVRFLVDFGYIFGGSNIGGDFGLVKVDSSNNVIWQRSYGGSGVEDFEDVQLTSDNGFIMCGATESWDGDVTGYHANRDGWVVKVDSIGNLQWQVCVGGGSLDHLYSIKQTSDGGFITIGYSDSNGGGLFNHGSFDFLIAKLDVSGNIVWQKLYGGSLYDEGESILELPDGNYCAVGGSNSNNGNVSTNHGWEDFWILKLDTVGNVIWQNSYGGTSRDVLKTIFITANGELIIGGQTDSFDGDITSNHGSTDIWIAKLNSITTGNAFTISKVEMSIYPNPASDFITIDFGAGKSATKGYYVDVKNIFGQTVYNSVLKYQTNTLKLNTWTGNGVYFVYLYDNQGHLLDVRKIVIQ